jgi:hypothetical protein
MVESVDLDGLHIVFALNARHLYSWYAQQLLFGINRGQRRDALLFLRKESSKGPHLRDKQPDVYPFPSPTHKVITILSLFAALFENNDTNEYYHNIANNASVCNINNTCYNQHIFLTKECLNGGRRKRPGRMDNDERSR